jgi:hypothetical protein
MENAMRKKTSKRKPGDSLLKTSNKEDIELTEKELGKVSGGIQKTVDKSSATLSTKAVAGER